MTTTVKLFAPTPRLVHVDKDDPATKLLAEILGSVSIAYPMQLALRDKALDLLASAPSTLLLWEPWRVEVFLVGDIRGDSETKSIAVSFLPIPVHHAARSLSCLLVAGEKCECDDGFIEDRSGEFVHSSKCPECHGTGYVGTIGEGRDAAGNSVLVELPPLEIELVSKNIEEPGIGLPSRSHRLVTAPMRVKVTVTTKCPDCRGSLVYGDRNCSVCANSGTTSIATTVSLPSLVVRHPLFPCEAEGVWSSMEKLQENKP